MSSLWETDSDTAMISSPLTDVVGEAFAWLGEYGDTLGENPRRLMRTLANRLQKTTAQNEAMIEYIARGIAETNGYNPNGVVEIGPKSGQKGWQFFIAAARAAVLRSTTGGGDGR